MLESPTAPGLVRIEAPMVGTFYRAPDPGADPFVSVGDVVIAGQTLCILEAMKLMNEVKVDQPGTSSRFTPRTRSRSNTASCSSSSSSPTVASRSSRDACLPACSSPTAERSRYG